MSEKDAKFWRKFTLMFPPTNSQREEARILYQQYLKGQLWNLSTQEILTLELPVLFDFYYRLALFTTPGRINLRKQSTIWFAHMHVCIMDLRKISGWLGLLKFAPLMAHRAIAIKPFSTCSSAFESSLVTSHIILDQSLHEQKLSDLGFSLEQFLPFIFEALSRLKISVGFVLYPYVAGEAIVCQKRPELFQQENQSQVSNKKMFLLQNPESLHYLRCIVEHYCQNYNFDFVYYDFTTIQSHPQIRWSVLESRNNLPSSFAVLGSRPLTSSAHLKFCHVSNIGVQAPISSKILLKKIDPILLDLIYFLANYMSNYPCIFILESYETFFRVIGLDNPLIPSFSLKNISYDYSGYSVWIWGNRHKITVLLAVWEDQTTVNIDLSDFIQSNGFYQRLIWKYKNHLIEQKSDELVCTSKLIFHNLTMSEAQLILINI